MTSSPVRGAIEVEVRYAETDQMGVVHHANYLVWFELARTHLCTLAGFHYASIEELGYHLMVTAAKASYRRGARYGDRLQVTGWVDRLASRGIHFSYEVHCGETLLATGATEHVWVDAGSGRLCRMPDVLREPFEGLAGQ